MMKKPKVSVLLASYKHPLWIGEAIESVLNQTYKDLELIIVDDGSNDDSADIIKEYASKDERIKYEILQENKGAIFAMDRCMAMSSCKYIAIISSDDIWVRDKLAKQVNILDENKDIGAVFSLPEFINAKGEYLDINNEFKPSIGIKGRESWLNHFFYKGNCICHPSILIRKECYDNIGFYKAPYRSLPDFEMWVRLFNNYDIKVINEPLIKFRKHDFNESGSNISNLIRHHTEYKQILNNYIKYIRTVEDLERIFPESKELFKVKNDLLVPFYIGQLALNDNRVYFKDFAFDILYTEMSKPDILELINQNKLYSVVELSKDVVEADIYSIYYSKSSSFNFKIPLILQLKKSKENSKSVILLRLLGFKLFEKIKKNNKTKFKLFYITVYKK